MNPLYRRLATGFALLCLPLGNLASAEPITAERLAAPADHEWLSHGRDQAETRFSPLAGIDTSNVGTLDLAWHVDLPSTRGLQGTPLVADGVMYVTGNWNLVHALDPRSGEMLWTYDPGVPRERAKAFCCGVVNRGVALWQNLVLMGTLDGYLVAIDRDSGKEVWRTLTVDQNKSYTITGAPRVVKGVVIIGNGGAEYGVRGYVSGYDARDGSLRWRFYTVPGNPDDGFESPEMAMAAKTWTGEWWTMGGGGTVWDSMAYDPELDLIYVGVGNGSPHNREMRSPGGGDNLFLASIIALRPETGDYVWHHQQNPGETWDYTAAQQIVLTEIQWRGEPRKVLMQAPKNGFFFILDRESGELLSAEPFVPVNWASGYNLDTGRPVENPAARYVDEPYIVSPSGLGGHNWHSMSYNPDTGLMYIPAMDFPAPFEQEDEYTWVEGHWNLGYKIGHSPFGKLLTQAMMRGMMENYLLAWDPLQQLEVWRAPNPDMGGGGVLSTGGDLVFQGTSDNRFAAYHASTGETLWSFDTQHGIVAAPIAYSVDGIQYITVLAGQGGGYSMIAGLERLPATPARRVLTFALNGADILPAYELPPNRERPPPVTGDSASVERGGQAYQRFCARCHGNGVVADGSVPDLRRLPKLWYEQFDAVVLDGMMEGAGMPRFDDVLSPELSADIKAYVLDRAHDEWALQQHDDWWLELKTWFAERLAALLIFFIT